MSEDHAANFDTYHSLHPTANIVNKTDTGGGYMPIQYEEERARMDQSHLTRGQNYLQDAEFNQMLNQYTTVFDGNIDQYAPTTDELVFNPDLTYDQWLFEILRRDPEMSGQYWDAERNTWRAPPDQTNLVPANHVYSGLTRDDDTWLPGQIYNLFMGMAHPGTDFATAQQLTNFAFDYDNPARRRLWEYQQNEARYMNNYINVALGALRDVLPEGDKMSVAIYMGMVELMKGTAVGSQKYYSARVFQQLRNIRELTRAAEGGVELEELQEAVDILQRPENAFRNIRLVEENVPAVVNDVNQGLREVIAEFPPRNAATNPDWQEFLRATNRTGQVIQPMADPTDPANFDMTVEEATEYSENLQEWIRFQQKNIYRDIIRENPNITFEEANILQTGRHTVREETWANEWDIAEGEYIMNELDRLLAEPDHPIIEVPEEKVAEAGGEPPVWELDAPPPELQRVDLAGDLARAELENVLAGEILGGMAALVPIGQMRMDSNEVRNRREEMEWFKNQEYDRQRNLAEVYNGNAVFVRIGGGWYRGVAHDTDLLWHQRDQAYTNVTLTDLGDRIISVPIEQQYIRLATEFQPDRIATQQPYGELPDTQAVERFITDMNQFESLDDVINQDVFVKLADGWHRGTIEDFQLVPLQDGTNPIYGAAVRIPFKTVGGRQDTVLKYIPVNADTLQFDTQEWTPDQINFWEPGTDPTEEFHTDNMHIEDHRGEQIYTDGLWRTLVDVGVAPGYPNNKTLIFEDGSEYVLRGRALVPVRLYGEVDQTPADDNDNNNNDDDDNDNNNNDDDDNDNNNNDLYDQTQLTNLLNDNRPPELPPLTTPITKGNNITKPPQYNDDQGVMSYLLREHNEVYTIWKNPEYTGTDPNRVERIFGGVVPFMSYNSEGHPILMNDQEINHHGHSEFNMVHVSKIETKEEASGQITDENTATIQQTNQDTTK